MNGCDFFNANLCCKNRYLPFPILQFHVLNQATQKDQKHELLRSLKQNESAIANSSSSNRKFNEAEFFERMKQFEESRSKSNVARRIHHEQEELKEVSLSYQNAHNNLRARALALLTVSSETYVCSAHLLPPCHSVKKTNGCMRSARHQRCKTSDHHHLRMQHCTLGVVEVLHHPEPPHL